MYEYGQAVNTLTAFLEKLQDGVAITDNLDLFESGVITSLRFVDFVIVLEEISGREIDPEEVDFSQLRTLSQIKFHYLRDLPGFG